MKTTTPDNWQLYSKASIILMGIVTLFYISFIGREILLPILFSTIIAILLNPVVNLLVKYKFNRVLAISLAVVVSIILIVGLCYFLVSQVANLSETTPQFKEKFTHLFKDGLKWASETLNISSWKIQQWLDKTRVEGLNNSTEFISDVLVSISDVLVLILLLPVYIFMILFYKPMLLDFISQLFNNEKQETVHEVLHEGKALIQNYLIGLLIEAVIVAALNSVGLLMLGIQYAILIGIVGALLNMIPYIGGLVAISLPMLMALATKEPIDAVWVCFLYLFVQFVDNNIIVPKIVASKVKVNALVSIVVILIGGALWGVAGMFLAIPITAILKVIFDRIPGLQPIGFLIGDNQPQIGKIDL